MIVNVKFTDIVGQLSVHRRRGLGRDPRSRAPWRKPDWKLLPEAFKGSVFLLSLVLCASMMPVEKLPAASWQTAFGLGFVSAVFDNIPLTALALKQGGYDWGLLAYAVGFGGSMIWFGSSAGVALVQHVPGGEIGRPVAAARLARRARLRDRLLRPARGARLAAERAAQDRSRAAAVQSPRLRRHAPFHIVKLPCGARERGGRIAALFDRGRNPALEQNFLGGGIK